MCSRQHDLEAHIKQWIEDDQVRARSPLTSYDPQRVVAPCRTKPLVSWISSGLASRVSEARKLGSGSGDSSNHETDANGPH